MQHKKILYAAGSIILIVGIAAVIKLKSKREAAKVVVETVTVTRGNISNMVTATGTVEPIKLVEVGTQVSGEVEHIYVDFNSVVKKGQLIAELDKTNLNTSVTEAQTNYNTAVYEMNYLQKIYDRQEALYQKKIISETDYEEALYKLVTAKGTVEKRKTDLEKAKTNLSYASIYSPIDGVILSRSVDVGQTVAASFSTPTLFAIAQNLEEMQVEADVDEADIGQVKEGQRVTFTVDAFQGEEFNGKVTQVRLNPTITSNVVTYTVVIKAENPELKLMPGLTATISIYTLEVNNVLTLPQSALNFIPDQNILMQYDMQMGNKKTNPGKGENPSFEDENEHLNPEKGTPPVQPFGEGEKPTMVWVKSGSEIQPHQVQVGETDGIHTQIMNGVNEGDSVVIKMTTELPLATPSGTTQNSSPFMPKPPGQNKKK